MDSNRFDDVARACFPLLSRRGLAGLLGLTALGTASVVDAKRKKRKNKNKNKNNGGGGGDEEVKLNAFGCVNVGKFCQNSGQCCSGICKGSTCKAHDVATCLVGQTDFTCAGVTNVDCLAPLGGEGRCLTTTGNAGYCAGDQVPPADGCLSCNKDADCISACGPNAACILCANCPDGRSCAGAQEDDCGG